MGFFADIVGGLSNQVSTRSLSVTVTAVSAAVLVLIVVLHVLSQLLFKNPKEPPLVFHWVPFIGSTVTYGIDPYKFFFKCRAKVDQCTAQFWGSAVRANLRAVWGCVYLYLTRQEDNGLSRHERE